MPRSATGTFTLASSSFVTQTTISSAAYNSNLSDIAIALTQSIATTGVTTCTGPLPLYVGAVGAPSMTTNTGLTCGFFRSAANTWAYSASGTKLFEYSASGLKMTPGAGGDFIDRNGGKVYALPIGSIWNYGGTSAPNGFLLCYGQAVSQTTYADLYNIIGVNYGNPGGGNFNLPDCRGRVTAGLDNMGGVAAGRLSNAATNGVDGTTIGNTGGLQSYTILQTHLPTGNWALTTLTVVPTTSLLGQCFIMFGGGTHSDGGGGSGTTYASGAVAPVTTLTGSFTGTVTSGGSGTALNTVQPTLMVTKIIYTGVYAA